MGVRQVWRQTPRSDIVRRKPTVETRAINEAENCRVLDRWSVPVRSRNWPSKRSDVTSMLGDDKPSITVWFPSVALLVAEAVRRGFEPHMSEFVDVGCGAGLAMLYAVDLLGFSRGLGIEFDSSQVAIARQILADAAVSLSTKERICIMHADAANYVLPQRAFQGRFIFIFNAFGVRTLTAFVRRNQAAFAPTDVIALANDVSLLGPLIDLLPHANWLRNDDSNCSLIYPIGAAGTGASLDVECPR